jgi:hypothetical protein
MVWFMVTLRKIAAIVHGKWPLNEPVMQRMVYSELLSS